jgi:tetratricopeptide (TPR) repeat protein
MLSAESAYIFRHALLREAASQLHLPGDRARLHTLAFEILEAWCGGRPPETNDVDGYIAGTGVHPADAFAAELAGHAAASEGAVAGAAEGLYLLRAALHAERGFRTAEAGELWRRRTAATSGADRSLAGEYAARALWTTGRRREALAVAEAALQEAVDSADTEQAARVRSRLSQYMKELGHLDRAEELIRSALEEIRGARVRSREASVLGNMASLERARARFEDAERLQLESLAIYRAEGNRKGQAQVLGDLSLVVRDAGRPDDAARFARESLELAREARDPWSESRALGALGVLHKMAGRLEQAEEMYRQALALAREIGYRDQEGTILGNLGSLHRLSGRFFESENEQRAALSIAREIGDRPGESRCLTNLANLATEVEDYEAAEPLYRESVAVAEEAGDRRCLALALGNLADLLRQTGRPEEAEGAFVRAIEMHRAMRNRTLEGSTLCGYGLLLLARGDLARATEVWTAGAGILRDAGQPLEARRQRDSLQRFCVESGIPMPEGA